MSKHLEGITLVKAGGSKPADSAIGSKSWPDDDECIGWGEAERLRVAALEADEMLHQLNDRSTKR